MKDSEKIINTLQLTGHCCLCFFCGYTLSKLSPKLGSEIIYEVKISKGDESALSEFVKILYTIFVVI